MAEQNTNPEENGTPDPKGQPMDNAQGDNTPASNAQNTTPEGAQKQPGSNGKPAGGDNTPEGPKSVPMDRFSTVYRRMKEAERKLQEKENTPAPAANNNQNHAPAPKGAPNWADYEAAGKSEEEYTQDWVDYRIEQGVTNALAQAEAKRKADAEKESMLTRQEKAEINLQTSSIAARQAHSDYDSVLQTAQNLGIGFHPAVELVIAEQVNAGEIGYQLAKNHEVAYKLMTLPPDQALLELGRFMDKIPAGNSQPAPQVDNLDNPLKPLNGGGALPSKVDENTSDEDFDRMFPPD